MTSEEFVAAAKLEAKEYGVTLHESPLDHVAMTYPNGVVEKCNGFFDEAYGDPPHPVLAWQTGTPFEQWFPIFIHEYNHMRQWIEKEPTWAAYLKAPDFFNWLNEIDELSDEDAEASCLAWALNEVNCDARVVQMLSDKQLSLDIDHYIRTANAYAWFYFWALEHRSWYTIGYEPYNTAGIVEAMPEEMPGVDGIAFNKRNYKRHYRAIFERHMLGADQNILFSEE